MRRTYLIHVSTYEFHLSLFSGHSANLNHDPQIIFIDTNPLHKSYPASIFIVI